jgi:tetratricopeptide (TPR) repeat protein
MKRLVLCLSLSLMVIIRATPLQAQGNGDDDDEDRFVTVHFGTLYDQTTPELVNLIANLQDNIPLQFEESGITLLLEQDPEFAAVNVILDFADDLVFVDFEVFPPRPTLLPSPYLALGYYLNADCESMLPHLDTVAELVGDIEELDYASETIAYLDFYRANCAIVADDLELAITLYEGILTFFEENGYDFRYGLEARINLAWTHHTAGGTDLGYDTLGDVIGFTGIDWATVRALELRAHFYLLDEEYDSAIADLDEALTIKIDDPYLIGQIINIFIILEDFKAAGKELSRLGKIEDGYPVTLFYEGVLAYADGDNIAAEDFLSEFVALGLNDYLTLQARELLAEIQAR